MTTREWLNRGFELSRHLAILTAARDSIANVIARYDSDGTQSDHKNSAESSAIRWSETQREIEKAELELRNIDLETIEVLKHLDNRNQFEVLYCRYVKRLSWDEVKKATNYSEQHVFKLHTDGIKECTRYMASVKTFWG